MGKERVIKDSRGVRFIRAEGGNYSSLTSNESSGEMEGAGKKEKLRRSYNVYKIRICIMVGDKTMMFFHHTCLTC